MTVQEIVQATKSHKPYKLRDALCRHLVTLGYDAVKDSDRYLPDGTVARACGVHLRRGDVSEVAQMLAEVPGVERDPHRPSHFWFNARPRMAEVSPANGKVSVSKPAPPRALKSAAEPPVQETEVLKAPARPKRSRTRRARKSNDTSVS